ncbi:psi-producing oxygenase A-like [Teratosphaeria destructans]|uniref:Psi-producing oxygenase A-like n=1 Tax=Teratosphaeria destructans TaxID=418781 RepID=A0A9W7W219_9PEZI|nr:psi-producing oxygenase A-like [Teratosphaeria destructans]
MNGIRPRHQREGSSYLDAAWDKFTGRFSSKKHDAPASPVSPTPEPIPRTRIDELRERIADSVTQIRTLAKDSVAPLPTQTGDGSRLPQERKQSTMQMLDGVLRDIGDLGPANIENLIHVAKLQISDEDWDDKKYYMERLIQAAALLPPDKVDTKITDGFLTQLWNDLEHPPQTLLSHEYAYRQPDGSNNNYQLPHIGKAGMPYARTVAPKAQRLGAMPDPGLLFDTVMARKNAKGTDHPNKISSMLFYLASIIIHDVFKTNRQDYNISDTSSYLDLAPLYGSQWKEQKQMRTFKDGKIKPDCFSETRLLTFPPGVGALLIMFNRYHNYVVEQLALINENGRFTDRGKKADRYGEKDLDVRDDDLFQTGRLITCGLYVNIILIDYVRTILNLNRTDENWQLNPRVEMDGAGSPPRGTGNQVSAEFNLVYRWHAAISTKDDKWTQKLYAELMKRANLDMTPEQAAEPENIYKFLGILGMLERKLQSADPEERAWPALQEETLDRIKEGPCAGNYRDDDLAKILTDSINDCANAYGPQQVPTVMKAIEVLGINQARTWRVATLNEFRKHFKLEPHREFRDITDNVEVQEALKHLYETPDEVELYPGLVVEDAKRPMLPGSGLCPSYTVSRGVLSDAVALVRGDRFYTTSFTPASLTNWGYQECSSDLAVDNGCVFYKLFLRALPNNFDSASVWAHYPMTVPRGHNGMQEVLEGLGKAHKYNFDPPMPTTPPVVVFGYDACSNIMKDRQRYYAGWARVTSFFTAQASEQVKAPESSFKAAARAQLIERALSLDGSLSVPADGDQEMTQAVRSYFEQVTTKLLVQKSKTLAGRSYVDIVRDVGNLVPVHFAAELFHLPLKTAAFPGGILTEHQLYTIMALTSICIFFDVDPSKSFVLRQQAYDTTRILGECIRWLLTIVKDGGSLARAGVTAMDSTAPQVSKYGLSMIEQLVQVAPSTDEAWVELLGTASRMASNQGQLFASALDFFSSPEGKEHWPKVQALARSDKDSDLDALMHYFMEASRLNGETGCYRTVADDMAEPLVDKTTMVTADGQTTPYEKTHKLKKGQQALVNLKAASRDPSVFRNPNAVDLTRSLDDYIHLSNGPLSPTLTRVALTTMFKAVARLDDFQPALVSIGTPKGAMGPASEPSSIKKVVKELWAGSLDKIPESWHYHEFLTEGWDVYFPFQTGELDIVEVGGGEKALANS